MKVDAFKKWLNSCDKANLILINGPEDFFKLSVKKYLTQKKENTDLFSYTSDELTHEKLLDIVSEAETLPFLSDTKFFFLRDIDKLNEKSIDLLTKYFDDFSSWVTFVLTAVKFDGRCSLYKKISKKGLVLKAASIYDNQCGEWIDYLIKPFKKNISRDAKALFIDLVGTSLITIQSELKKISIYIKDKNIIEYEDVLAIINSIKINTVFELTDAIGKSDSVKALSLLKNMRDQGTHEILVLSMIARHFKILLKIKDMKSKQRNEIASELKINSYFINNYIDQASRLSSEKSMGFYEKICEADFLLKSSKSSPAQVIENLILSF